MRARARATALMGHTRTRSHARLRDARTRLPVARANKAKAQLEGSDFVARVRKTTRKQPLVRYEHTRQPRRYCCRARACMFVDARVFALLTATSSGCCLFVVRRHADLRQPLKTRCRRKSSVIATPPVAPPGGGGGRLRALCFKLSATSAAAAAAAAAACVINDYRGRAHSVA